MYQITKADMLLGYTETPEFCYLLPSGSPQVVRLKDKNKATGVIYQGTVYNLPGHSDFDGAETATVVECDGGFLLTDQAARLAAERSTVGGTPAARLYVPGEYIVLHGTLYRVTLPIPAGGTFAPGANCEATSIVGELQKMNQ